MGTSSCPDREAVLTVKLSGCGEQAKPASAVANGHTHTHSPVLWVVMESVGGQHHDGVPAYQGRAAFSLRRSQHWVCDPVDLCSVQSCSTHTRVLGPDHGYSPLPRLGTGERPKHGRYTRLNGNYHRTDDGRRPGGSWGNSH